MDFVVLWGFSSRLFGNIYVCIFGEVFFSIGSCNCLEIGLDLFSRTHLFRNFVMTRRARQKPQIQPVKIKFYHYSG